MDIIKILLINFAFASGLVIINKVLAKILYELPAKFEYGEFHFSMEERLGFSGNFFLKIVNPTVYTVIVAALVQCVENTKLLCTLWMIVPIFWALRGVFLAVTRKYLYLNIDYEIFAFVISLSLGTCVWFFVIRNLFTAGETIAIPATALRDALWFAVIAYLMKTFWDILKSQVSDHKMYPEKDKKKIITEEYCHFRSIYDKYIELQILDQWDDILSISERECLRILTYSIMIYENFYRPPLVRAMEYSMKLCCPKKVMSLGVMQVHSNKILSSEDSIRLAIQKIGESFMNHSEMAIFDAIKAYNPSEVYLEEVSAIFFTIYGYEQKNEKPGE